MIRLFIALSLTIILTACGGGSGGDGSASGPTTATGFLKDSSVQGLSYASGEQSGTTGADGSFTYTIGQTVTFTLGGITIGSAMGSPTVTPVDFVASGSTNNTNVLNIVRFLMMLDTDQDPTNGISISPAVIASAASWVQPDFASGTFVSDTTVTDIVAAVASADSKAAALPTAGAAQTHVESTILCAYSGAFAGRFSGDDTGNFGFLVDASTGLVLGVGYSNTLSNYFIAGGTGTTALSLDTNHSFTTGVVSTGTSYTGAFSDSNTLSGTWNNTGVSGTFNGTRIGGSSAAKYRFTGYYQGTDAGLFTVDIDASNNITGLAYSVVYDLADTLKGTISGSTLSVTGNGGAAISGTINLAAGTISGGTWNNTRTGDFGTYAGGGCELI